MKRPNWLSLLALGIALLLPVMLFAQTSPANTKNKGLNEQTPYGSARYMQMPDYGGIPVIIDQQRQLITLLEKKIAKLEEEKKALQTELDALKKPKP